MESPLSPPSAAATTTTAAAAAPLQLVPVQDPESATRAPAEPPQVQVSCSTEGPALTAPTSYETEHSQQHLKVIFMDDVPYRMKDDSFHKIIIYKLRDFIVVAVSGEIFSIALNPIHYNMSLMQLIFYAAFHNICDF